MELKMVSHLLILSTSEITLFHDCKNPFACPLIPRKFLICDDAIVIAAAEVNPDITGYEKNSITTPVIHFQGQGAIANPNTA